MDVLANRFTSALEVIAFGQRVNLSPAKADYLAVVCTTAITAIKNKSIDRCLATACINTVVMALEECEVVLSPFLRHGILLETVHD